MSTQGDPLIGQLRSPHQRSKYRPLIVLHDARRGCTPESLYRSIDKVISAERAPPTRVVKTVTGAVTRIARSGPVLVAGAAFVAMVVVAFDAWQSDVGRILITVASITLGAVLDD